MTIVDKDSELPLSYIHAAQEGSKKCANGAVNKMTLMRIAATLQFVPREIKHSLLNNN